MTSLSISAFDKQTCQRTQYDAFIACVGFEPRSRFIAETVRPTAKRYCASAFDDRQTLDFATNLDFYRKSGYQLATHDHRSFRAWADSILREMVESTGHIQLCIDISSMSRVRMASLIAAIIEHSEATPISVDFVYAIAKYSPPPLTAAPITTLEPVIPLFAGWSNSPEDPVVAIVGLGYEPDKVIGAIEFFEPQMVWAFVPEGNDPQFLTAVERSNDTVWDDVPFEQRLRYKVLEPCNTFARLESLCYGLRRNARPILIPFGPKIFAALCMLVAAVRPDIGVWRVSGGVSEEPIGRSAEGTLTGIRCIMFSRSAGGKPGKSSTRSRNKVGSVVQRSESSR